MNILKLLRVDLTLSLLAGFAIGFFAFNAWFTGQPNFYVLLLAVPMIVFDLWVYFKLVRR